MGSDIRRELHNENYFAGITRHVTEHGRALGARPANTPTRDILPSALKCLGPDIRPLGHLLVFPRMAIRPALRRASGPAMPPPSLHSAVPSRAAAGRTTTTRKARTTRLSFPALGGLPPPRAQGQHGVAPSVVSWEPRRPVWVLAWTMSCPDLAVG